MKKPNPKELSNEQLAKLFKKLCFQQAADVDVAGKYNQLFDRLHEIAAELRARGAEARRALIPLLACSGTEVDVLRGCRPLLSVASTPPVNYLRSSPTKRAQR
jgi:hypothetical protein